jgi:hypothetical protein
MLKFFQLIDHQEKYFLQLDKKYNFKKTSDNIRGFFIYKLFGLTSTTY